MTDIATVNELSAAFLTFTFKDEKDADVIPATIDWRVDDVDSGTEIIGWTVVAVPAASVEVQIAPADNAILDATKVYEPRRVTVRVDSTLSTQSFEDKTYNLRNLGFAPS
jgi:hypothetical protein